MNSDLLDTFFSRSFEQNINDAMQELKYVFPKDYVLDYINKVVNIGIEAFLTWLDNHSFFIIEPSDMQQISSFESSFYDVVYKIIDNGNKGFRYEEIGKMLQDDGISRKKEADRKYGENHAKCAEYLGYLYSMKHYYYSSCIGAVVRDLSEEDKRKLYIRLMLRTNLFRAIYALSSENEIRLHGIFDMLSDSTYIRRRKGISILLMPLLKTDEYNFSNLLSKIKY